MSGSDGAVRAIRSTPGDRLTSTDVGGCISSMSRGIFLLITSEMSIFDT